MFKKLKFYKTTYGSWLIGVENGSKFNLFAVTVGV